MFTFIVNVVNRAELLTHRKCEYRCDANGGNPIWMCKPHGFPVESVSGEPVVELERDTSPSHFGRLVYRLSIAGTSTLIEAYTVARWYKE